MAGPKHGTARRSLTSSVRKTGS